MLGPVIAPDDLTVTVSVGASLFDARFGLAAIKPRHLAPMPSFPNDALDPAMRDGDLLLQFCANTAETNIHALRDILKNTPDLLAPRWKMEGFLPPRTMRKLGQETVRNLLGFKDGTANLDADDAALMDELVWVEPGCAGAGLGAAAVPIRWCASSACSSSAGTARRWSSRRTSSDATRSAARRWARASSRTSPISPPIPKAGPFR